MASTYYVPLADYIEALWPQNVLEPPPVDRLGRVWIEPPRLQIEPELTIRTALLIEEELALAIPGVDGVSIVLAAAGDDSAFMFEFFSTPSPGMRLLDLPIAVRFAPDLLKPATVTTDEQGNQVLSPATGVERVDITLAKVTISVDFDGGFGVDTEAGIDLPPCYIGDTGVGIQAQGIRFVNTGDTPPPGRPAGWSGIHIPSAGLWLPGELGSIVGHLTLTDASIGNGGFSGAVADTWAPPLAASLGGMQLELDSVAISFVQNAFTQCELHGRITLPFFDVPLGVEIGVNLDGSFSVRLETSSGVLQLTKPDLLELEVHSLGFSWDRDAFAVSLSGLVKPLVGGLDWPSFDVRELSIDSEGNVRVDGGWLDLRDGYALDFHGFKVEITRIGFGRNDDGGKWIGFSGSLRLVDGISEGASVDGLRVIWYEDGSHDPRITLDGVGVELLVPDTLSFKGTVTYHEVTNPDGSTVHQFDGDIKLALLALDVEADAVLVIGTSTGADGRAVTYFAIALAVELPGGIPLWSTGLGLYGLAGIFAVNYEPDRRPEEEWYGVGPSDGWYKRPEIGVTDLVHKWRPADGSLALGAGLTLGTVADNGFIFSGREVLVLVFPGPILMIEGKANILRERAKLSDEAIFRSLAVLDGRAGTILFGLDAQYKEGSGGELIDIRGSAEGFFDFHDYDRWHLYLGLDDPKDKRIRAELFSLFESNAYFMVDAHGLRTGAWVGYDKSWRYGPVRITLEAWLETGVQVSWKPPHYHGELWAHGSVKMKVFGFGFGMTLDAKVAGDVFKPFHLLADLSVELDLPWPIPNVDVDIELEWGPEPTPPPIPMVLKEIAIEHLKVTTSWPLPRGGLLLPNYDQGGYIGPPAGPSQPADLGAVPVVPLDCRPHITFGRSVHDAALIGNNPQPPDPPAERIGDPGSQQGPATVKYVLRAVTLEKLVGGVWSPVARKADTPNSPGVPELYGSWAPVPGLDGTGSVGQVKLWLWSRNAFDYTRATSGSWDEWFTDHYPSYPCIPDAPETSACCDFTRYAPGASPDVPHNCGPDMTLVCFPPARVHVAKVQPPIGGLDRAAVFPTESFLEVSLLRPARHVTVRLVGEPDDIMCVGFDAHGLGGRANAFGWHGLTFTVFGEQGLPEATALVREEGGVRCLDVGARTEIALPVAAGSVALTFAGQHADVGILGLDSTGRAVAAGHWTTDPQVQELVLEGPGIGRVVATAEPGTAGLASICVRAPGDPQVSAVADFADGTQGGPFLPVDGRIIVEGEAISAVTVRGRDTFRILDVCARFAPDPKDTQDRQELEEHLRSATARWSQVGSVLEPNTAYRLTVLTRAEANGEDELSGWSDVLEQVESAYFRTEGPPGLAQLSVPVGHPSPDTFASGLDDLARYVRQTVPATVPPPGQKPLLPKPVYRAYDVGVEFDEDYVDLMYRIAGRDLGLYVFDNNQLPVRDASGRLIVRPNEWGAVDTTTFDATDLRWIEVVNTSTCAVIDLSAVPRDVKLSAGAAEQVLGPDALYEARLTPLLLHEIFAGPAAGTAAAGPDGRLGRWQIVDQGTNQGPSSWQIAETAAPVTRYVTQTTNIWGGSTDGTDPVKPGSLLILGADPNLPPTHPDQPGRWTDYRLTAYLRNEDDDAIGLVFRYADAANHYRFTMDAERQYRRLVRVVDGVHTVLDEDDRRYRPNVDYAVTVEAVGPSLRVYVDGEPILQGVDAAHPEGGIGLYCWASEKARFFDITVDDFRAADPSADRPAHVYRFGFTTSRFAHFTHHVHSFDDLPALAQLGPDATFAEWTAAAGAPGSPITEPETRAYEALAHAALGSGADAFPAGLELSRVEQDGHLRALLCRTAEPFAWSRVDLRLLAAAPAAPVAPAPPGALKLISVSFATTLPREESVTVLARDTTELTGCAVEAFAVPGPLKGSLPGDTFFTDFAEDGHGRLFEEAFGPNALDHYEIVDQGELFAPSAWSVVASSIRQTSSIGGGPADPADIAEPGTMAITGSGRWGSVRIRCRLLSTDDTALGVVFRYVDAQNYYRFSTDSQRSYRRLVSCVGGRFEILWEDAGSHTPGMPFELRIEAFGGHLVGQMDHEVLFDVVDDSHPLGQVGLYTCRNPGGQFQELRVDSLEADPVLLRPPTTRLDGWIVLDPPGAADGPSSWTADDSGIHQRSRVHVEGPDQIGAHLITGGPWNEFQFAVDLSSDEPATLGVLLRYRDSGNYYRFSLDGVAGVRRLVKCTGGTVTTLWQDPAAGYEPGRRYRLSIQAQGSRLTGFLDGTALFAVSDATIPTGGIGLYTWNNAGATFSDVRVLDLARYVSDFAIFDGAATGESAWRTRFGELQQRSAIGDTGAPAYGTHAVARPMAPPVMRLTVEARSDIGAPIGVLFNYLDENHYYRFSVSSADHARTLIKVVDGAPTTLWQTAGGYAPGTGHRLTVDTFGARLVGYFDGERQFDLTDAALPAGRVGIYAARDTTAAFGSVRVGEPPVDAAALFGDAFGAGDLSTWTFVSEATTGGPPNWIVSEGVLAQTSAAHRPPTDPADLTKHGLLALAGDFGWGDVVVRASLRSDGAGAIGIVFRYRDQDNYYRFSTDRAQGYRRLVKNVGGVFAVLWEDAAIPVADRGYELVVAARGGRLWGYLDRVPMFAAEDAELGSGRIGLYCWRNTGARFSSVSVLPIDRAFEDWAFKDNFPYLVADRWSFVDAGDVAGPATWDVADNTLVQTAAISGDRPWQGTYAVSAEGSREWTDLRVAAGVTAPGEGTIGVAARYRDPENHYRFEIGAGSGRRLVKVVDGEETELWSDTVDYPKGTPLVVSVDCVGQRIACYVNAVPTCEVIDDTFGWGRVALFAFGNPGAAFAFVQVAEADWQPYYSFGTRPVAPAGRRIRILAGPESAAPAAVPNTQDLFVAGPGEQGEPHFLGSSCDLRIVDPHGNPGHTRTFLRSSMYEPVSDLAMLRRADGTGFALLRAGSVTEAEAFGAGEYRLELTYRRDNTAVDPDSQILREAGHSGSESAHIDITLP